jgi:hypothetical protein
MCPTDELPRSVDEGGEDKALAGDFPFRGEEGAGRFSGWFLEERARHKDWIPPMAAFDSRAPSVGRRNRRSGGRRSTHPWARPADRIVRRLGRLKAQSGCPQQQVHGHLQPDTRARQAGLAVLKKVQTPPIQLHIRPSCCIMTYSFFGTAPDAGPCGPFPVPAAVGS